MHISKELTAQMESCIKQSHIEVTKTYSEGLILEINGGAACFSGYDSFLSQVVGWGFETQEKDFQIEIDKIENFYKSMQHSRVDIELCPFVGTPLASFLSHRGYEISELNNVSVIDLKNYKMPTEIEDDFLIRIIHPSELQEWAKKVAEGFGYPEAQEQFTHYAKAQGIASFAVFHQNKIVAGATVAIHGDVCDLAVTSTLATYRNQGLQKRLLHRRLNFARQQGLQIATVTTTPGSISDLNIQKSGFQCAYTRIKMTLDNYVKSTL